MPMPARRIRLSSGRSSRRLGQIAAAVLVIVMALFVVSGVDMAIWGFLLSVIIAGGILYSVSRLREASMDDRCLYLEHVETGEHEEVALPFDRLSRLKVWNHRGNWTVEVKMPKAVAGTRWLWFEMRRDSETTRVRKERPWQLEELEHRIDLARS